MGRKAIGVELLVVGAIVLIVSVGADLMPFSVPGFGWKQIVGTVAGVVLLAGGGYVYRAAARGA